MLIFRWHSSAFLIYAFDQPLKGPSIDYTSWFSLCAGFPQFIIQHYSACLVVDLAVIIFSLACFISEKHRSTFCILLIISFFIQRQTLEIYSCTPVKGTVCLFAALLPFCFKDENNFNLMTETVRYFLIFILVSSAIYKFSNGELLHCTNFSTILLLQHIDLATLHPQHISYRIALPLISNPIFAGIVYILLFLLQLFFLIGFFTKKADRILFILLFLFVLFTYFIMRIYNSDILLLGLSLLYFGKEHAVKKPKYVG